MTTQNHITAVNGSELLQALMACVIARRPAFTWGHPGIGKSDIHRQLAAKLGALLLDFRASQWDAVDTRGVPYVEDKTTRWAVPGVFPTRELAAQHPLVIVFLDELNSAPAAVQAALYQLILDRKLGDYELPDNVVVLAAGNLETDRAVTTRMSTALADRFFHFLLDVDYNEWESWALGADIETEVIAFLRWKRDFLHHWEAQSASKAQATPRGWEYVSDILKVCKANKINGSVERALVAGKIGEAVGAEFCAFLQLFRNLPDPMSVLMDPEGAPLFSEPSLNYAIAGMLSDIVTDNTLASAMKYGERMAANDSAGPEYMTVLVRNVIRKKPELQHTREYIAWAARNAEVLV